VLDQNRAPDLGKFTKNGRRRYVQHILLIVKLPEYDCDVCKEGEDKATQRLYEKSPFLPFIPSF
jgi:hypothetical protein